MSTVPAFDVTSCNVEALTYIGMQPEGKAAATYSTATTEKESNLIFPRAFERGRAKMGKERAEFVAGKKKPNTAHAVGLFPL